MRTAWRVWTALGILLLTGQITRAHAQTSDAPPPDAVVTLSGSVRTRIYAWNWFGPDSDGDYVYPASLVRAALAPSRPNANLDWQIEFAAPIILGLPSAAATPPPSGQLGLGAAYFAANANSSNTGAVFLKQGFVRWRRLAGVSGQSLSVGRFEFNDGAEVAPKNATLAALERDRLSQRLIGTFGFADVGRSVDGAAYGLSSGRFHLTAIAGRPTQGVFDVNGWPELRINLFYGALTTQTGAERSPAELRVFAIGYDDYRHDVVKVDNRQTAIRNADSSSVAVATLGGHYIQTAETKAGAVDLLLWAAIQTGSWGALEHRAGAFAVELGVQPNAPQRLKLWIRGGYDHGSGDADPGDRTHGTFFQVLPTPRIYARLPFFNMMNSRDGFIELVVRPAPRVAVRTDVHAIHLASSNDLWYSGGGAFEGGSFGYAGRPSNHHSSLATLYDGSADWTINAYVALSAYYGRAAAGAVPQAIYGSRAAADFGYLELMLRF